MAWEVQYHVTDPQPVRTGCYEGEDGSNIDLASAGYDRHEIAFYAACPDRDNDTLTDCFESFLGTDASSADTDGDGLLDAYERDTPGCDPLVYNGRRRRYPVAGGGAGWHQSLLLGRRRGGSAVGRCRGRRFNVARSAGGTLIA